MPSGMRVMDEAERQDMLAALARSKHDTECQLRAMPFLIETPSQVRPSLSLFVCVIPRLPCP